MGSVLIDYKTFKNSKELTEGIEKVKQFFGKDKKLKLDSFSDDDEIPALFYWRKDDGREEVTIGSIDENHEPKPKIEGGIWHKK